jgi:hypothetical protein
MGLNLPLVGAAQLLVMFTAAVFDRSADASAL